MSMYCKLYLVRHGESVNNRDNIVTGHFDSPLTQKGRAQARDTKKLLRNIHFDVAYSSDLQRATATGEIIFGRPISKDRQLFNLRERTFGRLEGTAGNDEWQKLNKTYEQKYAQLPFEERWGISYADFIESDKSLYVRFEKALRQIAKQHPGQTVLIATHGGNIRVTLMKLGYAPLVTAGSFANAGYVVLAFDGSNFQIEEVVGYDKNKASSE